MRRLIAYLADSAFIFIIYLLTQIPLEASGLQAALGFPENILIYTTFTITFPMILIISFIEIITAGKSPGKIMMRLKVDIDSKSSYIYLFRNFVKFLFIWEPFHLAISLNYPDYTLWPMVLGYAILGINFYIMFKTSWKSSLHDKLVGSDVIRDK